MKGFKKDGKFRPTGNKSKSSLKKSDVRNKKSVEVKKEWWDKKSHSEQSNILYPKGEPFQGTGHAQDNYHTAYEKETKGKRNKESLNMEAKLCEYCNGEGSYDNGGNCVKCDHCKGSGNCTHNNCDECEPREREKETIDKVSGHVMNPKISKELRDAFKEFGEDDIDADHYNPEYKLLDVHGEHGEYFVFPDEESAISFGRQSIRDTATEYLPDEYVTDEQKEWKGLKGEELVDKIIEVQSDYGQRSELGAVAQSVASVDGQYSELSDGSIIFQVN